MADCGDLSNLFDRCFVISLARRPDRLQAFNENIAAINWPFKPVETFSAIDGNLVPKPTNFMEGEGAWGCLRSHQIVLDTAFNAKCFSYLVMEDDCEFPTTFLEDFKAFYAECPEDWDGIWIGGQHKRNYWSMAGWRNCNGYKTLSPRVAQLFSVQRTHCFAVRRPLMLALQKLWDGLPTHCDWPLGQVLQKFKVYAPIPWLAYQRAGKSDITGLTLDRQTMFE
jgi:GR25 family glycosyltransferase involved in LPS biosynthesis